MKKTILTSICILPFLSFSQFSTPEVYGELGIFYEEEFEPSPNIYLKLSAGLELFSYKFIAPEIDVSYYAGSDEDERSEFNDMLEVGYIGHYCQEMRMPLFGGLPLKYFTEIRNSDWCLFQNGILAKSMLQGVL